MSRDDYYELLGVDGDAPVDDIRVAYRTKKAAVADSATDDAKAEAAALNKAWNVLSDPYQRGRYDQQLADGAGDDVDEDEDESAPVTRKREPAPRAKGRTDTAKSRRNPRAPLTPTVTLPAGMEFPAVSSRLIAMAIDVLVLIALFLASQLLILPPVEKSQHRAVYNQAVHLTNTDIPNANKAVSDANKAQSAAEAKVAALAKAKGASAADKQAAADAAAAAKAAVKAAKDKQAALTKQFNKDNATLAPLQHLVMGGYFLVALLVLVLPSVFGRQTLGKHIRKLRVVRMDGSPARLGDMFRRYGVLVIAAYALSTFLGPVGALIVVFVATMWTRNPNQQALHDRFAKTLVVTDAG